MNIFDKLNDLFSVGCYWRVCISSVVTSYLGERGTVFYHRCVFLCEMCVLKPATASASAAVFMLV